MPAYIVREKSTGVEVTRYSCADIDPTIYPGDEYEHVVAVDLPYIPSKDLTHLEFIKRLTPQELVAIYSTAKVNMELYVWVEMFRMAEVVNAQDPLILMGLLNLEAAGLLAAGRTLEILNG